jgi:hypothetical protein
MEAVDALLNSNVISTQYRKFLGLSLSINRSSRKAVEPISKLARRTLENLYLRAFLPNIGGFSYLVIYYIEVFIMRCVVALFAVTFVYLPMCHFQANI